MKAVRSQLFFVILLRKKISFRFNFQEDMNTAQHMLALHVIILIVWEIMNRQSKRPLCGTDDFGRSARLPPGQAPRPGSAARQVRNTGPMRRNISTFSSETVCFLRRATKTPPAKGRRRRHRQTAQRHMQPESSGFQSKVVCHSHKNRSRRLRKGEFPKWDVPLSGIGFRTQANRSFSESQPKG